MPDLREKIKDHYEGLIIFAREESMKVIDPVCGMTIEEKDAAATLAYQGKTYHFCSTSCQEKFEKDPEAYAE